MKNTGKTARHDYSESGFSLVELMIAIAITGFILAATFASYSTQQKSQVIQGQVADIQQNIRAAMLVMTRDIREAGCNPTQSANPGILTAERGRIRITRDIAGNPASPNQGDGDLTSPEEDIIFSLDPAIDANTDGIPDAAAAVCDFGRNDVNGGGVFQAIAENIERVEFNYIDANGNTIAAPVSSQSARNHIRAVQISMLVRATRRDPKFLNRAQYTTATGAVWGPFNDGFRRRLSVTTIQLRNMGL